MKFIFSALKVFLYAVILFGIVGIIVGIVDFDISILIFYVIWCIICTALLLLYKKCKKYFLGTQKNKTSIKSIKKNSAVFKEEVSVQPATLKPKENRNSSTIADNVTKSKDLSFPDVYISLDVETPNRHNNSISQIGLYLIENGRIAQNYCTLINPEDRFDPINRQITGLNPSMVARAPKLNEYWPLICDLFREYVIVAHNATFDLNVLCKSLKRYNISFPEIKFVCTYVESINKLPSLSKHTLSALAEYYGVQPEKEHDAGCDAKICHIVFEAMKKNKFTFAPTVFYPSEKSEYSSASAAFSEPIKRDVIDLPFSDNEDIRIEGCKFVLTGTFTLATKAEIVDYIETNGGFVMSSVSGRTNYLIVGSEAEDLWKHGNYGLKIQKALELKNSGKKSPKFIKEKVFIEQAGLK